MSQPSGTGSSPAAGLPGRWQCRERTQRLCQPWWCSAVDPRGGGGREGGRGEGRREGGGREREGEGGRGRGRGREGEGKKGGGRGRGREGEGGEREGEVIEGGGRGERRGEGRGEGGGKGGGKGGGEVMSLRPPANYCVEPRSFEPY